MLGSVDLNNKLCACAIKIYNIASDDTLLEHFYRIAAKKVIP